MAGVALVVFVGASVSLKPIFPFGVAPGMEYLLVFNGIAVLALLAGHVTAVLAFERLDWSKTGFGAQAWHPRDLALGLALGACVILLPAVALAANGNLSFVPAPDGDQGAALLTAAGILALPALTEELLLRGYAFGTVEGEYGRAYAIAATSAIFGALHVFNPGATPWSIAGVTLAGVFLGAVRSVTGSVVAAWLAHLAVNWVQGAVLHAPISGLNFLPTPDYRAEFEGPAWLTGGRWGLEAGAATALAMAVVTFLVFLAHSRMRPKGRQGA